MTDDPSWPDPEELMGEGAPSFEELMAPFETPAAPANPEPLPTPQSPQLYMAEIPPDNEHGDGVRNPIDRPCAGVRGNGLMTPKVPVKSEDWRDYNYSDFGY